MYIRLFNEKLAAVVGLSGLALAAYGVFCIVNSIIGAVFQ